uniref:Peptidase A2 domain-containing protein n=1 Tax=Micromonas pusilla TaxID=38833 RepID=A0A7S0NLD9_MICPS|mmetsp:Transcript_4499/g.18491  ORF Transcript_4499/g.18491 Transcript_4499/m.18491 type:complete len:489 (+) Transcript_4499:131-1597(+)
MRAMSFASSTAFAARRGAGDVRPRKIAGAVVRVPRVQSAQSAQSHLRATRGARLRPVAASDDSESKSSSADTLSALDALLGADPSDDPDENDDEDDEAPIISIPLLFMRMPGQTPAQQRQTGGSSVASALTNDVAPGPGDVYAAITLGLPDRATKKQQERGVKGVELDFCVDTACTTNFILPQVAYGLDVQIVGTAPAGTGATGAIGGGQEMLLGTAKLGGKAAEKDVVAITGLTAAVVPVPAPNVAGILGRSFLNCFDAVAFDWGPKVDGSNPTSGAVMDFYQEYDWDAGAEDGLVTADLDELACGLLAVNVTLNGVKMPALLDTGAPRTIVNRAAAAAAGIAVGSGAAGTDGSVEKGESSNPFGGLMDAFGKGKEAALAAEGVMVMGAGGKPERLDRVDGAGVDLRVVTRGDASASDADAAARVSVGSILVGELAAFQAGLGLPPAIDGGEWGEPGVILGLDALTSRDEVVISTRPAPRGRPRMQL